MNVSTKALTSMAFVLILAVGATTAFASVLKSPYLIYPGQNTQMEVLWQDSGPETTNVLSWGTDTTYSMGKVTVPKSHRLPGPTLITVSPTLRPFSTFTRSLG